MRRHQALTASHMVDVFGSVELMCGLGCSGLAHWKIAPAMLIAFLILASESFLATHTLSRFELSQGIFGPTEVRLLLIVGSMALLRSPYATLSGRKMLLLDVGAAITPVVMISMAICVSARYTVQLYREEPLP